MSANYSANPAMSASPATRNTMYAIPMGGAVAALASLFLTWYSATGSSGSASTNALAQVTSSISNYNSNGNPSVGYGFLGAAVVLFLIGLAGFLTNRRVFAILDLILGLLATGFGALILLGFMSVATDDTNSARASGSDTVYSVGLGVYLMVAGFAIVLIGSIVALMATRRSA